MVVRFGVVRPITHPYKRDGRWTCEFPIPWLVIGMAWGAWFPRRIRRTRETDFLNGTGCDVRIVWEIEEPTMKAEACWMACMHGTV